MSKLSIKRFTDLADAQRYYLHDIDARAEAARSQIITSSPGQSMTYEVKVQEANRYPQGTRFPFLTAEAEALGMTAGEVADSILKARDQWETYGAKIEASRLKAKAQVRKATTAAEMHQVVADLSFMDSSTA